MLGATLGSAADPAVAVAAAAYRLRQGRLAHPVGGWDDGHRWWPDETEYRPCCASIRAPSRAWPWSLMTHCRTVLHVAALYGVEEKALRSAARRAPEIERRR